MIVLKGEPKSTQHIYKISCARKFAKMYMSKQGVEIKERYKWEMLAQKKKMMKKPIRLEINLYFKTKRKHDIDNYNKLPLDAGNGILWEDDSLIEELIVKKHYDKDNPRITLQYESLSPVLS